MLRAAICKLWGHKVVKKTYTGDKLDVRGGKHTQEIPLQQYEVQPFCLRCGQPNKYYFGARAEKFHTKAGIQPLADAELVPGMTPKPPEAP